MGGIEAGARFGRLTVMGEGEKAPSGRKRLRCRCECGQETMVEHRRLLSGHKQSCGCLRSNGAHLARMTTAAASANLKPIVGERFGRLVIVGHRGRDRTGDEILECVCDCGATAEKKRRPLIAGDTRSCGCLHRENALIQQTANAHSRRRAAGMPEDQPMTPTSKALRDLFDDLSVEIKRRDDFTCVLCRARGVRLHVHHIEPWRLNPALRFEHGNLVTLCRGCHIEKAHGGNVHRPPDQRIAAILKRYAQVA